MPGGTIEFATCAVPSPLLRAAIRRQSTAFAERLADADVIERRPCWCRSRSTAIDSESTRRSCGPSVLVVGEPGGVDAEDRGVVEIARREGIDRTAPAEVVDQLDRRHGRFARPVARIGGQRQAARPSRRTACIRHSRRSLARGSGPRHPPRPGRDDRERRAGDDVDEVGRRPDEVDHEVAGCVVGVEADGRGIGRRARAGTRRRRRCPGRARRAATGGPDRSGAASCGRRPTGAAGCRPRTSGPGGDGTSPAGHRR